MTTSTRTPGRTTSRIIRYSVAREAHPAVSRSTVCLIASLRPHIRSSSSPAPAPIPAALARGSSISARKSSPLTERAMLHPIRYDQSPPGDFISATATANPTTSDPHFNTSEFSAIVMKSPDRLPVAVTDSMTINEDAPAAPIPVLVNDTDLDGDPLNLSSVRKESTEDRYIQQQHRQLHAASELQRLGHLHLHDRGWLGWNRDGHGSSHGQRGGRCAILYGRRKSSIFPGCRPADHRALGDEHLCRSGQRVGTNAQFLVSSDNPDLFDVQPMLAADGTLNFTPAPARLATRRLACNSTTIGE